MVFHDQQIQAAAIMKDIYLLLESEDPQKMDNQDDEPSRIIRADSDNVFKVIVEENMHRLSSAAISQIIK